MSDEPQNESERIIPEAETKRIAQMRKELADALPDDAQVDTILAAFLVSMSIRHSGATAQGVQRVALSPQQARQMGLVGMPQKI